MLMAIIITCVARIIGIILMVTFYDDVKGDTGEVPISWVGTIIMLLGEAIRFISFNAKNSLKISKNASLIVLVICAIANAILTFIKCKSLKMSGRDIAIAVCISPFCIMTMFAALILDMLNSSVRH